MRAMTCLGVVLTTTLAHAGETTEFIRYTQSGTLTFEDQDRIDPFDLRGARFTVTTQFALDATYEPLGDTNATGVLASSFTIELDAGPDSPFTGIATLSQGEQLAFFPSITSGDNEFAVISDNDFRGSFPLFPNGATGLFFFALTPAGGADDAVPGSTVELDDFSLTPSEFESFLFVSHDGNLATYRFDDFTSEVAVVPAPGATGAFAVLGLVAARRRR